MPRNHTTRKGEYKANVKSIKYGNSCTKYRKRWRGIFTKLQFESDFSRMQMLISCLVNKPKFRQAATDNVSLGGQ